MPLRLGAIALPIGLLLLARKMPSPLAAFRRANATAPETARKPSTLNLPAWSIEDAQRKGLIVSTGDGRYYLDVARDRARRRVWSIAMIAAAVLTAPLAIWVVMTGFAS